MTKIQKLSYGSVAGVMALALVLPLSSYADQTYTRTTTIRNTNSADITNTITVRGFTGGNVAHGAAGNNGASGGAATGSGSQDDGSSSEVTGGDGGNGGNGGAGGIITTGDVESDVTIENEVNSSDIDTTGDDILVNQEEDDIIYESTTEVENNNTATLENPVVVDGNTGSNTGNGSNGGAGAPGGSASQDSGTATTTSEGSTTVRGGRGGNGGHGGMGGDILTGASRSMVHVINVLNRTMTRVQR